MDTSASKNVLEKVTGFRYALSMASVAVKEERRGSWTRAHFVATDEESLQMGVKDYLKHYPEQGYGTFLVDREEPLTCLDVWKCTLERRESCE